MTALPSLKVELESKVKLAYFPMVLGSRNERYRSGAESKNRKINSRIRYGGWFKKLVSNLTTDV